MTTSNHVQLHDLADDPKATGFEFPGTFEVTAFGASAPELVATVLGELAAAGVVPDPVTVRQRRSEAGRYLAVTVAFACESRALYEAAYARLRAHPAVRMTL